MNFQKAEMVNIETAVVDANDYQLRELDDLQLALVGGGVGETVLS